MDNLSGRTGGTFQFKVVLLGEGAVGKTSLVLRYVENKFNDKHITTLQASYLTKKLNINGKRITLSIWDTAGQERFHALGPIYYRGSNGAVLVYDITDEDSFQRVQNWVKELRKMLGNDVCLVIVGNKLDLEKDRHISEEQAQSFAVSVGAKHLQTSAKLNKGIEEMFFHLTQEMLQKAESAGPVSPSQTRSGPIVVDDSQTNQTQPKSGCCS